MSRRGRRHAGRARRSACAAAALLLAALALPGEAHRVQPALASLAMDHGGHFALRLTLNAEAVLAGIGPEHDDTASAPTAARYGRLRSLEPGELRARIRTAPGVFLDGLELAFDGEPVALSLAEVSVPGVGDPDEARLTTLVLRGRAPADARAVSWRYPARLGASALRLVPATGPPGPTLWLEPGAASPELPLLTGRPPPSRWAVAARYLEAGFAHILPLGADHILFVLGMFLLGTGLAPLLWQVTAFTVAHSVTLGLAVFGVVSLPGAVVEPLIAASIVYVAVENLATTRLHAWRVWVVFVFGLLHGLGFAGVLVELGIAGGERVIALVAFNVGVELGQLAVIALAYVGLAGWLRRRPWYRRVVVVPCSAAIALVGVYWTVARVL